MVLASFVFVRPRRIAQIAVQPASSFTAPISRLLEADHASRQCCAEFVHGALFVDHLYERDSVHGRYPPFSPCGRGRECGRTRNLGDPAVVVLHAKQPAACTFLLCQVIGFDWSRGYSCKPTCVCRICMEPGILRAAKEAHLCRMRTPLWSSSLDARGGWREL